MTDVVHMGMCTCLCFCLLHHCIVDIPAYYVFTIVCIGYEQTLLKDLPTSDSLSLNTPSSGARAEKPAFSGLLC